MKTVELRVRINVPDDYDYPFDTLIDANHRDDMEIIDVKLLNEF